MNKRFLAWLLMLTLFLFGAVSLLPEDAEAKRFGGGSSVGSRGSRSFSTPAPSSPSSTTQSATALSRQSTAPAATTSRWGSGMMGGIGGFLLGGMLGSMLFGDGFAGGVGVLDLLLIGGGIWLLMRWLRRSRTAPGVSQPSGFTVPGGFEQPVKDQGVMGRYSLDKGGVGDVGAGLSLITNMDPRFDQGHFIQGAKVAFERIQQVWSDGNMTGLGSLLTERMAALIQTQAGERKDQGRRDVVENIRFLAADISEVWQEAGEDWITVHFVVEMIEYETDAAGTVISGDTREPVRVEEYWTFTRPVASPDPNWRLSAVQQSGEVARGAL